MPSLIAMIRRVACACIFARSVILALQLPTACTIRPRYQELQMAAASEHANQGMCNRLQTCVWQCLRGHSAWGRFEVHRDSKPAVSSVSLGDRYVGVFHAADDMVPVEHKARQASSVEIHPAHQPIGAQAVLNTVHYI
jgi:hypothetical protein